MSHLHPSPSPSACSRSARAIPGFALILLGCPPLLAAQASGGQQTVNTYTPDQLAYSDYFCADVSSASASFGRELVVTALCAQERMSPSVRCNLRTRARYARFELKYLGIGADCSNSALDQSPINWEFGLEIDGVLQETGAGNPLYQGVTLPDFDSVIPTAPWQTMTAWVDIVQLSGGEFAPHDVSLIWPAGANVDLLKVQLKGVDGLSTPTLLIPPSPPTFVAGFFGDSITHGIYASHVTKTYSALLTRQEGWGLINFGYAGRRVEPDDAATAGFDAASCTGALADPLDLLFLAIGSNDFNLGGQWTDLGTFQTRYAGWITNYRALSQSPIVCITAIPRLADEHLFCGRTLEQYRERIRAVVAGTGDPEVYLIEGRDLVPRDPGLYDADGLHPNDAGFDAYASSLLAMNLIRNPRFDLKPLVSCTCPLNGCDPTEEVVTAEPYLWDAFAGTSGLVTNAGNRQLSLSPGAERRQMVYGLSDGEGYTFSAFAQGDMGTITLEFQDAGGGFKGSEVLDVTPSTPTPLTWSDQAPTGAVRCLVRIANTAASGTMLVDNLELTIAAY